MKIAAFSDTHGYHNCLQIAKDTDIAICCGDYSITGGLSDAVDFIGWYKNQPAQKKLLISGNIDFLAEKEPDLISEMCQQNGIIYLQNDLYVYNGIKIYGTPYTLSKSGAFGRSEQRLEATYDKIPLDTDILICHGPAQGVLDLCSRGRVGSVNLREQIDTIRPKVFLFGQVHINGNTTLEYRFRKAPRVYTRCFNVSICNEDNKVANDVTYLDF